MVQKGPLTTAYNGLTGAGSHILNSGSGLDEEYAEIWNGKNNSGRKVWDSVNAAGSRTPVVGNLFKSLDNGTQGFIEYDRSGKRLTYDEVTKIGEKQGDVGGASITDALAAKALDRGLSTGAKYAAPAINSMGRSMTSVGSALPKAGQLSGFGESVAGGLKSTGQRLQSAAKAVEHNHHANPLYRGLEVGAVKSVESAAHVAISETVIAPSIAGGSGHGGSHGSSESHGSSDGHGSTEGHGGDASSHGGGHSSKD